MQSGCIASRFSAVSRIVSPLVTLEDETLILTASADSRFAASSNDVRVRVEFSKKRFITVLPRRVGTFLISRVLISRKFSAVSKIPLISASVRLRMPSRSRRRYGFSIENESRSQKKQGIVPCQNNLFCRPFEDADRLHIVKFLQHNPNYFGLLCRHDLADEIRLDRQFTMLAAPVDQDGKLDLSRPAEVHQLVHRRPDSPARVQYVIDENDDLSVDIFIQFGPVHDRVSANGREVVTVKGNVDDAVHRTNAFKCFYLVNDPLGQRNAPAADADDVKLPGTMVFFNNFRSQTRNRPFHTGAVHYSRFFNQAALVHSMQIVAKRR